LHKIYQNILTFFRKYMSAPPHPPLFKDDRPPGHISPGRQTKDGKPPAFQIESPCHSGRQTKTADRDDQMLYTAEQIHETYSIQQDMYD
jgi:hypothetical protein